MHKKQQKTTILLLLPAKKLVIYLDFAPDTLKYLQLSKLKIFPVRKTESYSRTRGLHLQRARYRVWRKKEKQPIFRHKRGG